MKIPSFRSLSTGCLAALLLAVCAPVVNAEEVKVEGVHLCCQPCVKAATKALTGVNGVSDVTVSQDDETVTFQAKDGEAAQAGLKALSAAGFYGTTSATWPDLNIDATKKQNKVELSHMHLCCRGCTETASSALKEVGGVKAVSIAAKQGKMTVTGESISLADILKALHSSGFHATVN
jgi:copper chaperone CopZ